jgi:hypothetical protein
MKKYTLVIALALVAGCATAESKLRKLHEGMNQGEVEHVMGPAHDIKEPSENAQGHMVNIWMYNLGKEYRLFWVDDRLAAWALAEKWTPEDMRNLQLDFTLNDASRQYIKKLPGIETVAKASPLPIDGTWKRRDFEVKLAAGAGELVFTGDNPFNGKPFFQKIERTAPGKYACQNLGFSDNKRETWYAQCEIQLKSPTQLLIEYKPDASRGEDQGVTEYYDLGTPADQAAFDAEVKAAGL